MQPSRAPKKGKGPEPAAVHRGRRLGKGARRDIAWALQQTSATVAEIWVHGVKIVYVAKDAARDERRGAQNAEKSPPDDAPIPLPVSPSLLRSTKAATALSLSLSLSRRFP